MKQCRLIAIFSTPLSSPFDSKHQRVIARHQGLLLAESSRSCTAAFGQKRSVTNGCVRPKADTGLIGFHVTQEGGSVFDRDSERWNGNVFDQLLPDLAGVSDETSIVPSSRTDSTSPFRESATPDVKGYLNKQRLIEPSR